MKFVRVMNVPECGYIVIRKGAHQGTYQKGRIIDVSDADPEEVTQLIKDKYVEETPERPS
jgi:hypothetical protein